MFTILKCGAQGVQEHRVHNTTFEVREHYCFMSNDHFNLAKVMEGPCCGQRAFGIGSNKEKITRACRIALAVHGVGRAVANAPSSLAPLLAIVGNEFSREFASESDSNHTMMALRTTQFGVQAHGEVVRPNTSKTGGMIGKINRIGRTSRTGRVLGQNSCMFECLFSGH
jgi:hypothetical protein